MKYGKDLDARTDEIKEWLKGEFSKIRTGQANPAILDQVRIDSYGTQTPLNQVANITTSDARSLVVSPWDQGQVAAIEKSIREADLGVSVSSDEKGVRVNFPALTEESREKIAKIAGTKFEEARVALRQERDKVRQDIQREEKEGNMSEDESRKLVQMVDDKIKEAQNVLEEMFKVKQDQLTSV